MASEFTLATTTHLYNPLKGVWEKEITDVLGVSSDLFQDITQPGTTLGEINRETREKTGMGKVPIAAVACHDTGSAVAAVPAEVDDFAYISSGTWSLMGIEAGRPLINSKTLQYNITNEGGVAGTYRILKNISGLWLLQECRRAWAAERVYSYDELEKLGGEAEPLKIIIDPDWGGFLAPPSMPGAIASYCKMTKQRAPRTHGEFVRAVLEGLVLAYRRTLGQLEDAAGKRLNKIHIVGGGSRNALLSQLAADATSRRVYTGPAEATAFGNILIQAIARGRVRDLKHIRRIVRGSSEIKLYEPTDSQNWDEAYKRFLNLAGVET